MRATSTALFAVLSVIAVATMPAQTVQPVTTGARVRITAANTSPAVIVGQLIAVSDSALLIRKQLDSGEVAVPRSSVTRLEVSQGTRRGATARTGGLIGLLIGGVLGYAAGDDCNDTDWVCFDRSSTMAMGASSGAGLGLIIGFIAGSTERWRESGVPMQLSVAPTRVGSLSIIGRIAF